MQLVVKYVFDPYMKGQLPPAKEVPRLADTVWRLRPIADMAVNAEVARAMEGAINKYLGDVLTHIMDQLPKR